MSESKKTEGYDHLVIWAVVVFLIWALSAVFIDMYSRGDRGSFGDMFGAVNALFSGLAFAGLIYTIRQQKQGLEIQQQELVATRKEVAGQLKQMESQAKTLKLQQFETTFFQLLRVHGEIVESMDLVSSHGGPVIKGRDCFRTFIRWWDESNEPPLYGAYTATERTVYADFYSKAEAEVGHYFRHLYHVIKFVDSSDVNDKRRYTSFVRAQLSANELVLLFHNCLSEFGEEQFKPLVERYGLLKHLTIQGPVLKTYRSYVPTAYLSANPSAEELQRIGAIDALSYHAESSKLD